jgi:aspartate kinase
MRCWNWKRIVVIKMGGSVLRDLVSYETAARFLVRRLHQCSVEGLVVVVSAQEGLTDALERLAHEIAVNPTSRALDLLWSTGETRSVALLILHLEALDVKAIGLSVHEAGVRVSGERGCAPHLDVIQDEVQRALAEHPIVVIPGFLATDRHGAIVSLGRGGSDLTAVVVAEALGATQCELVKDVPGYFSEDPRDNRVAKHVPSLSYHQALKLADNGCPLVQKEALIVAAGAGFSLVIRSLSEDAPRSVVSVGAEGTPWKTEGKLAGQHES